MVTELTASAAEAFVFGRFFSGSPDETFADDCPFEAFFAGALPPGLVPPVVIPSLRLI